MPEAAVVDWKAAGHPIDLLRELWPHRRTPTGWSLLASRLSQDRSLSIARVTLSWYELPGADKKRVHSNTTTPYVMCVMECEDGRRGVGFSISFKHKEKVVEREQRGNAAFEKKGALKVRMITIWLELLITRKPGNFASLHCRSLA